MKRLFLVRRSELPCAALVAVLLLLLHSLMVGRFWALFADYSTEHFLQFTRNYHMSGFDFYVYSVLTHWRHAFEIVRHPLLAEMYYPLYLLNQLLWHLTGCNCAQLIEAGLLFVAGTYSCLFVRRTLCQVVGLTEAKATLLTLFFLSLAYVLLTMIVPDHFCLSLFCLTLALYLTGLKLKAAESFSVRETLALFLPTAAITLSNGALVLLMVLFANGRRFFRPRFFATAVVLPSVLMLATALVLNSAFAKTAAKRSSPIAEQLKWTHVRASRLDILQENFFGESLQLHRKHLLGDVCARRPVIVRYSHRAQNAVTILIQLLLAAGLFAARRERFAWLLAALLGANLLLHLVVGFAITEVHIMTAHWAYVLPLALGYLLRAGPARPRLLAPALTLLLTTLTLYLLTYHGYLLHHYLTWPLGR